MTTLSRLAGCFAGAAFVTASVPALAGDKALAEDLFRKAQSVMQRPKTTKDEVHQACQWFKESYDQDPAQNTQVALAACWEKEGKNRSAWGMYTDAAANKENPAAADYAKKRADALYAQGFPKLKIETKPLPEDAKVTLDGEPVGTAILNTEINADPGEHKLEVKASGKKDFATAFTLDDKNSPLSVPIVLEDAPVVSGGGGGGGGGGERPPEETSTVRTLGVIIGIAGLAAGAGALVSEILAQVFDANSKSGTCKTDIIGCAKPEHDKAVGAQGAAIGLGIAGGALIVTGIVMYFVGAPKKAEPAKASWHFLPTAGPQSAGGMLVGTF